MTRRSQDDHRPPKGSYGHQFIGIVPRIVRILSYEARIDITITFVLQKKPEYPVVA